MSASRLRIENIPYRYTMLMGSRPFYGEDPHAMRAKICNIKYGWPEPELRWPSAQAKALVGSLLIKAQDRFTTGQIMGHPVFTQSNVPGEMYPASRKDHINVCEGRDENGEPWPCVGFEKCPNPIGDGRKGALITLPSR